MPGLTFIDTLTLSWLQAAIVCLHLYIFTRPVAFRWLLLWYALNLSVGFAGVMLCADVRLTFSEAKAFHDLTLAHILQTFPHLTYYPFQFCGWAVYLAWFPAYLWQQAFTLAGGLLCAEVCRELYGEPTTRLLLMTPLVQLLMTQPLTDNYAVGVGLLALLFAQRQQRGRAAVWFALAVMVKPLALLAGWRLARRLRGWLFLSVVILAGYAAWAQQYHFGVVQRNFLLHQLGLKTMYVRPAQTVAVSGWARFVSTVRWRVRQLRPAVFLMGAWLLCPAWGVLGRMGWLAAGGLLVFGNLKYLLFVGLLFPLPRK